MKPHAAFAAVLLALAVLLSGYNSCLHSGVAMVGAASSISYTYTCSNSQSKTSDVAVMSCGCLEERKQLERAFGCQEAALYQAVIANCRTCAKRSDCNCTATPEETTSSDSSSTTPVDNDAAEQEEFREDVENFPWWVLFLIGMAIVVVCAIGLCALSRWHQWRSAEDSVAPKVLRAQMKAKAAARQAKKGSQKGSMKKVVPV